MAASRRTFLTVIGGGGIILAAGGGLWAATRDPSKARAPWRLAGSLYDDPIRDALSFAILAPNPHNRQPWLVDLKSETEATLYCDLGRLLPATDPYSRQITVGLGAFLEILRLAAAERGLSARIDAFPEGSDGEKIDARPVAYIRLAEGAGADPLFGHVLDRRTDRSQFDTARAVDAAALGAIKAAGAVPRVEVAAITDAPSVSALRDLAWRAWTIEVETAATFQESIDLMRFGKQEIEASPDGLPIGGPLLEGLNALGVMTSQTLADETSLARKQARAFARPQIESAMGFAVVRTAANARADQLAAGAAYVRMNLAATGAGVSMHPLSQALQEYPEMAGPYAEAHALLAPDGGTVQMLARIGYGAKGPAAARWPLETRLLGAGGETGA